MAKIVFSIRLESDDYDDLVEKAKDRGQTAASLARLFIIDGLAGYDQAHEATMQTLERMLEKINVISALQGASIHTIVEQKVLGIRQNNEETADAYKERLRATYTSTIFEAVQKGAGVSTAVAQKIK